MSCNDPIPMQIVADQVATLLSTNFIERDDPRITKGVFTEPSIRGAFMLDPAAKRTFSGLVQQSQPPTGKSWMDTPTYPGSVITSYNDDGEIKHRWVAPPTSHPAGMGQWGEEPPSAKPTITGAKTPTTLVAQNAIIDEIIAVLAAYGLITDNRT